MIKAFLIIIVLTFVILPPSNLWAIGAVGTPKAAEPVAKAYKKKPVKIRKTIRFRRGKNYNLKIKPIKRKTRNGKLVKGTALNFQEHWEKTKQIRKQKDQARKRALKRQALEASKNSGIGQVGTELLAPTENGNNTQTQSTPELPETSQANAPVQQRSEPEPVGGIGDVTTIVDREGNIQEEATVEYLDDGPVEEEEALDSPGGIGSVGGAIGAVGQ